MEYKLRGYSCNFTGFQLNAFYKFYWNFHLLVPYSALIDPFTINVSQIYGCFFPRDLVTSHFINLYLTMVAYISCCYVRQTLDKLSGCQKQPLLKWYA